MLKQTGTIMIEVHFFFIYYESDVNIFFMKMGKSCYGDTTLIRAMEIQL